MTNGAQSVPAVAARDRAPTPAMKTSICCAAKATFLSAMKTPVLVRRRTQHESEEEPSEPYTVSEVEELELPEEPFVERSQAPSLQTALAPSPRAPNPVDAPPRAPQVAPIPDPAGVRDWGH